MSVNPKAKLTVAQQKSKKIVKDAHPLSFFGFKDPMKKSAYAPYVELIYFVCLAFSTLCTIALVLYAMVRSDYIGGDTAKVLVEKIDADWWDYFNIFLLFIGIFWPAYSRLRDERKSFLAEATFSDRMVVSLNCNSTVTVRETTSNKTSKESGVFYLRTLSEHGVRDFFPDGFVRYTIDSAKDDVVRKNTDLAESNKREGVTTYIPAFQFSQDTVSVEDDFPRVKLYDPFLELTTASRADNIHRIRDHIRNKLSFLSGEGHLLKNIGIPTITEPFVWGVACEDLDASHQAMNKKMRIFMIKEKDLMDIVNMAEGKRYPNWDTVKAFNGLNDGQLGYFKKRWVTMLRLYEIYQDQQKTKDNFYVVGGVSLTFRSPEANKTEDFVSYAKGTVTYDLEVQVDNHDGDEKAQPEDPLSGGISVNLNAAVEDKPEKKRSSKRSSKRASTSRKKSTQE